MKRILLSLSILISGCIPAMATSYTAPDYTESTGNYITAANWNSNQTALMSFLNNQNLDGNTNIAVGGIQTANLANLSVTDAKIYGITTASKVNGSALTGLNNIPSGAGIVPVANLASGTPSSTTVLLGNGTWGQAQAYVKLSETETSGTGGGSATTGSWQTRVLNTKDSDTASIATLSSNQVTLPAGTYTVKASSPFNNSGYTQTRLYNVTGSAVLLTGTSVYSPASGPTVTSSINGIFTLSGSTAITVQYQSSNNATGSLGIASSFGTEVYTVAEFTKIS